MVLTCVEFDSAWRHVGSNGGDLWVAMVVTMVVSTQFSLQMYEPWKYTYKVPI